MTQIPIYNPKWGPGRWPSEAECITLMKESGVPDHVIDHTKMTAVIADVIAKRVNELARSSKTGNGKTGDGSPLVDEDLILAGALLHDIGRARDLLMRHAVEGVDIATGLGLPQQIINIIERHIGAGLDAQEAERLGLPKKDYIPLTLEEKIVAHADNLAGVEKKLKLEKVLADYTKKDAAFAIPRMVALHRELSALCGMDIDELEI